MSERLGEEFSERIERRVTRSVRVGNVVIGGKTPIVLQSMAATHTSDIDATVDQVNMLHAAGAGIVRLAIDSMQDVEALAQITSRTPANISADLQENYRLAAPVAQYAHKIRFNPGHLYHHERNKSARDKVAFIADAAAKYDRAIRVGVNCGSVEPELAEKYGDDEVGAAVESALVSCEYLDDFGFDNYLVSIKHSNPLKVIEANLRFAQARPDIPLHLGVTEAGLPSLGITKTRLGVMPLLAAGIGETLRVSLTVPSRDKAREILAGRLIIEDLNGGNTYMNVSEKIEGLNHISCPSCSRVENEKFVELAEKIEEVSTFAKKYSFEIATMGCRVNGPGETYRANLGLWCGPTHVRLMRKEVLLGTYTYDEIVPKYLEALNQLIASQ